jgi:hypothetical protein
MNAQDLVEKIHEVYDRYEERIHKASLANDHKSIRENYETRASELKAIAADFLACYGIPLAGDPDIEVFPHLLMDEGERKIATIAVKGLEVSNGEVYETDEETRYEVDTLKKGISVEHLTVNDQERVVEKRPFIPYKS